MNDLDKGALVVRACEPVSLPYYTPVSTPRHNLVAYVRDDVHAPDAALGDQHLGYVYVPLLKPTTGALAKEQGQRFPMIPGLVRTPIGIGDDADVIAGLAQALVALRWVSRCW